MQKHRTTILMAVLIALIGFYIVQSRQAHIPTVVKYTPAEPLAGKNEIRDLTIKKDGAAFKIEIEYRFRGDFGPAILRVYPLQSVDSEPPEKLYGLAVLSVGENKTTAYLRRDSLRYVAHTTRYVRVEMFDRKEKRAVVSKTIDYPIDWPRAGYLPGAQAKANPGIDELYEEAVAEIDYGTDISLNNARTKLETIVSKDARFVPVYPELARYYMKTNWGPEGLRQGERALKTGLSIDPGHANSHVLIGYIYAHQGRYPEAREAFTKASEIGTNNLWLWANWGELLLMQGKANESIEMYRKAIRGGRTYDTYDRARKDAYRHLIDIYKFDHDVESQGSLHLSRIKEYASEACYPYYYAKFRQRHTDDADDVLNYAKMSLDNHCRYEKSVRKVIGAAYYLKWHTAETSGERQSYLGQAQLFFPEGPRLIYWLAQSEVTAQVIGGLLDDGVPVDSTSNDGYTALAYAVKEGDIEAVKRIVILGADTNSVVGREKMPLLAIAVMSESKDTVEYLVENGADTDAKLYGGVSLLDIAEGLGYQDIVEVLKSVDGKRI